MNKKTIVVSFLVAVILLGMSVIFPQHNRIFDAIGAGIVCLTVIIILCKFVLIYQKGKKDYFKRIEDSKKNEN